MMSPETFGQFVDHWVIWGYSNPIPFLLGLTLCSVLVLANVLLIGCAAALLFSLRSS